MKILIINNTTYPPEIGKTDVFYYIKYLAEELERCDLVCYGKDSTLSQDSRIIGIGEVPKINFIRDIKLAIISTKIIFNNKKLYDSVYILNPLFSGIIPALFARCLGKKLIFDLRTGPISTNPIVSEIIVFLDSLIISIANIIIFINSDIYFGKHYFGKGGKEIHETLVGFEESKSSSSNVTLQQKDSNKKIFLYVGTLSKRRKLRTLIKAFNNTSDIANLFILGKGDGENYLKSISGKNIFFIGEVPQSDVVNYIYACDFGVSYIPVSKEYNLQPPLKTIEYLGCGKPVLATATKGNLKFINNKNGVIIDDFTSVTSIITAIRNLSSSTFSEQFIKEEAAKYTWKNIIQSIIRFLNTQIH